MPPTDLDGNGYLVEKWTYIGTPSPNEYDPNTNAKLVHQWEWQRDTSKSVLPQANEEDTISLLSLKKGWRATGLNAPQEFMVNLTW